MVGGCHDSVCIFQICHVGCHGTDHAARCRERGSGSVGYATVGGFETVDSAERGRDADAASAVCAEGYGEEAGGNCVRGAARGAAGIIVWVVGVEWGAGRGIVVCGV